MKRLRLWKVCTVAQAHPSRRRAPGGPQVHQIPKSLCWVQESTVLSGHPHIHHEGPWLDDVYLSLRCGALIPKVHWSRTLCKHSQGRGSHMWWRTWILDLISSLPEVNFSFGVSAWPSSVIITHWGNSRESKWGSIEWRDLEERVSLPPWRRKSPSYLSLGDKPAPNLMV